MDTLRKEVQNSIQLTLHSLRKEVQNSIQLTLHSLLGREYETRAAAFDPIFLSH
ncbi:hypothetical protein DVH05_000887 [Phytophthora capsici]|nr:hypothetical protein DVH05_000887 [Phytophthora capsici]